MALSKPISIGAFLAVAAFSSAAADEFRPYLTSDAAQAGLEACHSLASENEWRVAIAIKDRGGELVAFSRMDDVFTKQIEFAQIKAETSATTPLATRQVASFVYEDGGSLRGLEHVPGITPVEGGEPIIVNGYAIGGVGVSGATAEQDGACARAAARAISDYSSAD
ncbi:MAG: heme-binding protein [Pseudomonadota bacterium]|nr:heme-binding protein [Pseudomonadota bacterium]